VNDHETDAGRSAVAVVKALRAGDAQAVIDLAATLNDVERANLCGSLAALANAALTTVDAVIAYVQDAGYCGELSGHTSDQVLTNMMRELADV
jgi:hypothetical protein